MSTLSRPLAVTIQIIVALVAGFALAVFAGPVLDDSDIAVGGGGSGGILPGAQTAKCEALLCASSDAGSGGNVGSIPEPDSASLGTGGSGGVLSDVQEHSNCAICLGGGSGGPVGNVGEVPNGPTGSGGSGGILPGASADGSLLDGGTAGGSGGNVGDTN